VSELYFPGIVQLFFFSLHLRVGWSWMLACLCPVEDSGEIYNIRQSKLYV